MYDGDVGWVRISLRLHIRTRWRDSYVFESNRVPVQVRKRARKRKRAYDRRAFRKRISTYMGRRLSLPEEKLFLPRQELYASILWVATV